MPKLLIATLASVIACQLAFGQEESTERLVVFELMKSGKDGEFLSRQEQEEIIRLCAPVTAKTVVKSTRAIGVSDWTTRLKQWKPGATKPVFGIVVRIRPKDPDDAALLFDTAVTVQETAALSACCTALVQYGLDGIPWLLELVGHEDQDVREAASMALSRLRFTIRSTPPTLEEVRRATDELAKALTHPYVNVRIVAARTLGWPFFDHARVMSKMLAALKDKNNEVRYSIALAVNRCRPRAMIVAPALFECCASEDAQVRWAAGTTLRLHVRFPAPEDIDIAVAHLSHENAHVRTVAAEVLARLGTRAKSGVPSLLKALQDKAPGVRDAAALALARVDPENDATVPGLIAMVKRGDPAAGTSGLRRRIPPPSTTEELAPEHVPLNLEAVILLGCLGERAKPAVKVLVERMRRPDGSHVLEVVQALRKLGPHAVDALPQLELAMKDRSPYTAIIAAVAWIKAGGDKETVVPVVVKSFQGNNAHVHAEAALAVQALGLQEPAALPALRAALSCPTVRVRTMAAGAIAGLPLDVLAKLRTDLERVQNDPDKTVAEFVQKGLDRLRK